MHISVFLTHNTIDEWTVSQAQLDRLRALPHATVRHCVTEEEFRAALPETEAALVWDFAQAWFADAPRLRLLSTPSAGHERVNVTPPEGVRLHYGSFHGAIISQTVLAWLLGWARATLVGAESSDRTQNPEPGTQNWEQWRYTRRVTTLTGKRLVILGCGHIGEAIAQKALAFGMRVVGIRRHNIADLDTLLPAADYLVLALPATPSTDNLLDDRRLRLLPKRAFLCNVGRGNAIDEDALAHALAEGRLAGAALDVFKAEPLPSDSPLRRAPNCFLFPHISAVAPEYLDLYLDEVLSLL
ncbi:MAG: hypothetical protein FWF84_07060 [Kiritimatiellaeota bacterium]|nr:hypothetical protein [Kiritimatiellota bacterium]